MNSRGTSSLASRCSVIERLERRQLLSAAATALFGPDVALASAPATPAIRPALAGGAGLVIQPTFGTSITSDPNAALIENTINSAIQVYERTFTNPITVTITFNEGSGLGASSTYYTAVSYKDYRKALAANASSTDAIAALNSLPSGTNNPVNNNPNVAMPVAVGRALGFGASPPSGKTDSYISLNTSICNLNRATHDPNRFDLMSVAEHEIDEALGFGSALNGVSNGDPTPTGAVTPDDLYRYDQNGSRSFSTSASAQAYYSIDGGQTRLARFNQTAGGDFSDWYSPGNQTPQVQDAVGTWGGTANMGVELRRLNAMGYTIRSQANDTDHWLIGGPNNLSHGHNIAIQPDGKIVVVGTVDDSATGTSTDFFITRLNPDGSTDTSFGQSGVTKVDFNTGPDGANAVTLLPDGEIFVVGYDYDQYTSSNVAFARLDPNGNLLGVGSNYFNGAAGVDDSANAVMLQPDGKVVVACLANGGGIDVYQSQFGLMRLDPITMAMDPSFGSGGKVTFLIDPGSQQEVATSLALQPDGKIVVGGFSAGGAGGYNFAFARLLSNGTLDQGFANNGSRVVDFGGGDDVCYATAIQPDGKVLLSGYGTFGGQRDFLVARYNSNGSNDATFGYGTGASHADFGGGSNDMASGMVLQPDGKIVLTGVTNNPGLYNALAAVRFNSGGSLDTSFGPYGWGGTEAVYGGMTASLPDGAAAALDGDGRIVLCGNVSPLAGGTQSIAVARLTPGEYPFSGSPISVPATISAENYNNGGPDFAYTDTSPNLNEAAAEGPTYDSLYRPGSGVDLEKDSDGGGSGQHVAFIQPGECLDYTLNSSGNRTYTLQARVSSAGAGGTFHVEVDGNNVSGALTIPDTGGFLSFQTIPAGTAYLSAGVHLLRVVFDSNGTSGFVGNLKWISASVPQNLNTWTGATGGMFNDPANWSTGQVPSATDDILIDVPDQTSVTIPAGVAVSVHSLVSDTPVVIAGSLSIAADSSIGSSLALTGGSVRIAAASPGAKLSVLSLSITGSGRVDLGDGTLLVDHPLVGSGQGVGTEGSPLQSLQNYLAKGVIFSSSAGSSLAVADVDNGTQVTLGLRKPGDIDGDGKVDFNDLLALAQHYNTPGAADWSTGDFNYDGSVNFADLLTLAQHYKA